MDQEICRRANIVEIKLDKIHESIGELRAEVKALGSKQAWTSVVIAAVVSALIGAAGRLLNSTHA